MTRIENLEVFDDASNSTIFYNVDFVYDTAYSVYVSNLEFDFPDDETAALALEAVTDALNANEPFPVGAGPEGATQFFIGVDIANGIVAAVGGELIFDAWDQCETNCLLGVKILAPSAPFTYADFEEVEPSGDVVQVFITRFQKRGGELGGLAGADAECQEDAANAGLSGTWTAWLSDDDTDARDRIPDGQYQNLDGRVIADDKADLTDGRLNAPINMNELGERDVGLVWTGTQPDGTGTEDNCGNWTDNNADADYGDSSARDSQWTEIGATSSCNQGDFRLFCFGGGE